MKSNYISDDFIFCVLSITKFNRIAKIQRPSLFIIKTALNGFVPFFIFLKYSVASFIWWFITLLLYQNQSNPTQNRKEKYPIPKHGIGYFYPAFFILYAFIFA